MTRITYDNKEDLENKLEEALEATNDYLELNYGSEDFEKTAESLTPIITSADTAPTYDDIDRWMAEADAAGDSLQTSLSLKVIDEYLI